MLEFLKTRGFNLGISYTRSFTRIYSKTRYELRIVNWKYKKTRKYLEFDDSMPGVNQTNQYLHDLVEHEKCMNIAQFDKRRWSNYKNPYYLHD